MKLFFYILLLVFVLITFCFVFEFKTSRYLAKLSPELILEQIKPLREKELQPNKKLSLAAQMKAEDMLERDYFSHKGPDGELPWAWLDKVGYNYLAAGENLAMDVNDPQALVKTWLASPSHAKNIFNERFVDVGIGVAQGDFDGKETIIVVMFLGQEKEPEPFSLEPFSFDWLLLPSLLRNFLINLRNSI